MLTASLCDWRYSHADVLFIEVLLDLKERHSTIDQGRLQCGVTNSAVLSMLTASLCDWRYSHANLLFIEVLLDLKQMH